MSYVTDMATSRRKRMFRLYLKEHREARHLGAKEFAKLVGIERESVYRVERKAEIGHYQLDTETLEAYANALGRSPEELLLPPDQPSLDAMVAGQPAEVRMMAADIVRRLLSKPQG